MRGRERLNLDCAAAEPSDADSMKGKCHQVNCSLRVQYHDTTRLKPDLKVARQIDMMDQGRVKKGQKEVEAHTWTFRALNPIDRPTSSRMAVVGKRD